MTYPRIFLRLMRDRVKEDQYRKYSKEREI
jgi:hypothetical protein